MEVKIKKDRRLPIVAVLAAIILVAGITMAMIPSLKNYREEVRKQALEAEGRAVYYTAVNVVREADEKGMIDNTAVLTPDGKDQISTELAEELRNMIAAEYQVQVSKGTIDGFYMTDGKYNLTYDQNDGFLVERKSGSTEQTKTK